MKDETVKLAQFYDKMGRVLFHKFAQTVDTTPSEPEPGAEYGTGGKPKLTALVQKLMAQKGKK